MKIEQGSSLESNARYVRIFGDIPNDAGTMLRQLALSTEPRDGTSLVNALNADIQATEAADKDAQQNLIFAAILLSVNGTERGIIKDRFSGRGKPIPAGLFNAFAKDNPIVRDSRIPEGSGPIGHSVYYMDREAGAIMAFSKDGEPYALVAAKDFTVAENIEIYDITAERKIGAPLGNAYLTRYTSPTGLITNAEVPFSDLSEMKNPTFPKSTGIASYLAPTRVRSLANAIASIGQNAPRTTGIGGTGPLDMGDGKYAFLRQGKPALNGTGEDARYRAIIPEIQRGIQVLDIADPSTPNDELTDLIEYMGIGDITPDQPYIGLSVLGALAWAPCGCINGFGNVCVLIYGESGSLKTAASGLAVAAQSSENLHLKKGIDPPVQVKMRNNQSTVFGTDNALYYLGGTLSLADDLFAGSQSQSQIAQTYTRLSSIADNTVTGSGGVRGKPQNSSGQGLAVMKFPRCSILFTAEALPDEQGHVSETARLFIMKMEHPVNIERLDRLQELANHGVLSAAHSALINSSLPSFDRHRKAYERASEVVAGWNLGGHLRPIEQAKRVLAGLYVISSRFGELTDSDPWAFGDSAAEEIREAARLQVQRSGVRGGHDFTRDPVRLFIKNARLVLRQHEEFFAAPKMEPSGYSPPSVPGFTPGALGWRGGGTAINATWTTIPGTPVGAIITWEPGSGGRVDPPPLGFEVRAFMNAIGWNDFYKAVEKYTLDNDGWNLPTPDSLRDKLIAAKYMIKERPRNVLGEEHPRGYSLKILAILRGEMPDDIPEPEDDGEAEPTPEPEPRIGGSGPTNEALTIPGTEIAVPKTVTGEGDSHSGGKVTMGTRGTDTRNAGALALAADGTRVAVYFPNAKRGPFVVDTPKSLDAVFAIARRYTLTEIWIHANTMKQCGIPSVKAFENAHTKGTDYLSPYTPVPNRWANLPDSLETEDRTRGKIAQWMNVWRKDIGRKDAQVSVSIPAYDDRHSFSNAADGQELIDAVELYNSALPRGIRYSSSPNSTMRYVAKRVAPKFKNPVHALTEGKFYPADGFSRLLGLQWSREPDASELRSGFLTMDRNSAELAGFGTDYIGNGEPVHLDGPVTFKKGTAGYYRLSEQVTGYDERLPELAVRPNGNGEFWITGPDAELLAKIGILPTINEAWIWEDSGRYMKPMYEALHNGRKELAEVRGTPVGKIAYDSFGQSWRSFIGSMNRNEGAYGDDDYGYRPDIRDSLQAETYMRMYISLMAIARESGRYPVATKVDAVTYTANGPDDIPSGMKTDSNVGSYKFETYK